MNGGSDPCKPYHFLKECNENLCVNTCICVNCYNKLGFLAQVSTKLQKCTFLKNLRTINQEGNKETRQMTQFFSSTLSALTVCNIHFCI